MEDLAWIGWSAGIIDGEGSISISRTAAGKSFRIRVRVNNTDINLVNKMQELYGGSIYLKVKGSNNRAPQWAWDVNSKTAYDALKKMCPYLITKKEICDLAISYQENLTFGIGKRLSEDIIVKREQAFINSKLLNDRSRKHGELHV